MTLSRRSVLAATLASTRLRAADPLLEKATQSVLAAIPRAESDPERPVYHFRPPANWNNDPNGTLYYRGWHHLFYQFNPYGSLWGNMHWGHARSRDLVNWEHLPIALAPSKDKGEDHVFSGGAVFTRDGQPRLFYTSIGNRDPEQWMASPADDDLIVWNKSPRNPILTTTAHGAMKVTDWRDPFLFVEGGVTYMVCGGNASNRRWGGSGQVHLYRAENAELTDWKHLGVVFEDRNRENINIECPNLFQLDGKWVLITSPHRPCEYFIGTLDLARPRFTPETRGILDAGNDYASNISRDPSGRTILWLWGRTSNPGSKGWNSVMTMPRILSIGPDGFLRQRPAPEFEKLRGEPVNVPSAALKDTPALLTGVSGDTLELDLEVAHGAASLIRVDLRAGSGGKSGASITLNRDGVLEFGKASTVLGRNDRHNLRIFLDKRVFEVYANDGQAALYGTTDASREQFGVAVSARGGGAKVLAGKAWAMKPAQFDLSRFNG